MENRKIITNRIVMIHHDIDGILRNFPEYANKLFFKKYPEYKQYQVPSDKIRGWAMGDEFWPLNKAREVDKLMGEMFFSEKPTNVFRYAPPLITPDEWKNHIYILKTAFPNCRIVISTHQYTTHSKIATIQWLNENKMTHEDLIFTDTKKLFGADYLLDDKPQTIVEFHNNGNVGVLLKRERGNGWYRRNHKNIKFPMVNTLDEYRELILAKERVKIE